MKVYIIEGFVTEEEEWEILTVHSSLELAMAHYPDEEWTQDTPDRWDNGKRTTVEVVIYGAPSRFMCITERELDP